jgi:hypothetical protein
MFAELDREALQGTAVQTLQEAADDHAGAQIQPLDLLQ